MHSHAQLRRFTQVLHSIRERKLGSGAFLQHLAARIQSNISLEYASLVLNDSEAKGTQRSVEETPNYSKSRCYRLETGKAELWLKISHWVCPLCQEFGCVWITSFNSLRRVGEIERLDWNWCLSVSKFLFWEWSPIWPGFKPTLYSIYWTSLLHDIIKGEQLGPLRKQPGGFTTAYLADQAMKEN